MSRNKWGFSDRVRNNPERLTAPFVYAVHDGYSIKVGKSNMHPILRLRTLQTGNPRTMRLLAYTATITESQAHDLFARWRIRGEWFTRAILPLLIDWDWLEETLYLALLQKESTMEEDGIETCLHCGHVFSLAASGFTAAHCPRCGKPLEWGAPEEGEVEDEREPGS